MRWTPSRACVEGITQGTVSEASRQWFADRGPGTLLNRIRAPTLILAGSSDGPFGSSEAVANYLALSANDVPLKMMWYCGGHGQCQTPAGEPGHVASAALAWLNRLLMRDASVETDPRFEWVSDDGAWRSSPDFPLASKGTIEAVGSGTFAITALDSVNSGLLTFATPALTGVTVRFPAPPQASDVLGEPRLRLTYSGTALPARTFLYAQIIDTRGQARDRRAGHAGSRSCLTGARGPSSVRWNRSRCEPARHRTTGCRSPAARRSTACSERPA